MLKGLFRQRSFLEEGLEDWCLDAWAWLMRHLGGGAGLAATPLVLANTDFFPPTDTEGEARGAYLFERVKDLMGMREWDCELHAIDRRANTRVGEFWHLQPGGDAAGTFQVKDNRVIVSYGADLISSPRALIAVSAIPDIVDTVCNVTADLAVTTVVRRMTLGRPAQPAAIAEAALPV